MRIAHLVLAHANPAQLGRMIAKLSHPDADFYIHIDLKSQIDPFLDLANPNHVFFVKSRVKVYWAGYSQVQATVNGMTEILNSGKQYSFINLLSGQDYPLKSTAYIHDFLSRNAGKAFMHTLSVANEWQEAITRVTKYHLPELKFPGKHKALGIINAVAPKRKMPNAMVAVGRSQWFTMSAECAAYIVGYLKKHPNVRRFFQKSWAPDEMIFQTILHNSPLKDKMVNDNLRYIDWSGGKPNPKVFTMADVKALMETPKLFGRKFSEATDKEIMDYLDKITA